VTDLAEFTLAGMRAAELRWQRTRAELFPELRGTAYHPIPERKFIELPTLDTIKGTK
jgi:hypothetical protein